MSAIPSLRAALIDQAERALARAEIPQRCALCADAETRALFRVDGALIVACRGCGLVRQDTRPLATLAAARRLLVPGGLLHLVTPNVGGVQARLLGRHWYHYKPGEHLFYFAPTTLRTTVERAGLRWRGCRRSASYLTFTYVFNRLRYYAPAPFGFLEWLGRTFRFGPFAFRVDVGEMEAWAVRDQG